MHVREVHNFLDSHAIQTTEHTDTLRESRCQRVHVCNVSAALTSLVSGYAPVVK